MTQLTRIKEHVALITFLVVLSVIVVYTFTRMHPAGQVEIGQTFLSILMGVAFSVLFSFIPVIAIIYGWSTGNGIGAVLIGVCLLPALFILGYIAISSHNMVFIQVTGTILFVTILSGISGLAGYCAAQRTKPYLAVAIALTGLWIFCWMNAFN